MFKKTNKCKKNPKEKQLLAVLFWLHQEGCLYFIVLSVFQSLVFEEDRTPLENCDFVYFLSIKQD